ncbi:MAG: hypothetical protein EOP85_22405 [Verrucomicrobiaceae bacterium]|nr:MAG: hypothetical protein EOP85_22405 [Verrucomicrobiaceae bacterium]
MFNGVKFSGTYTTPGGALPITVFNKKFKGTREIKGVGDVTLSAKLEGGILKSGKLYFNVTNVKIKAAAPLPAGTIRFEKGAMLIVTAAPVVEFKSTSSSISESGEVINVEVTKSGKGKASVSFATASGTADSTNFTPTTGTLNFGSGTKTSTQVIQVPILPDSIPSGSRQFTITLSSPGGRAVLGAKVTHTVTINADEL